MVHIITDDNRSRFSSDVLSSGGRGLSRQHTDQHSSAADVKDVFNLDSEDSPEISMNSMKSRYSSKADAAFDQAGAIVPSAVPSYLQKSKSTASSRKNSESDSEASDGVFSRTSSPSMSVKEVMIRRVTKKGNRTPVNPEGVATETIYMQESYHSKSGYRSSASEMTIKQPSPAPTACTSVGYELKCKSPGTRPRGLTDSSEQSIHMVRRTSSRRRNQKPIY